MGGSRREFLRLAASGAAALGLAGTMTGCVLAAAGRRKLDFRDDFGVLNYAYALEVLESKFYERVVAHPPDRVLAQAGKCFAAPFHVVGL